MPSATVQFRSENSLCWSSLQEKVHSLTLREIARWFVEYLFVAVIILDANSIWRSIDNSQLAKVLKVALVAVVGLYFLINDGTVKRRTFNGVVGALVIALVYWSGYAVLVSINVDSFMYFVLDAFAVYAFVRMAAERGRGATVLMKYRNLILVVAAVSLFFWVFGSELALIQPTSVVYSTWGAENFATGVKPVNCYYGVYYEAQSITGTMLGIAVDTARNTAIFTEAPMSSLHFCIAFIIELFYCAKPSKVRCGVLIAAVLSTFSTTGYCMIVIALVAKFLFTKGRSKLSLALKAMVIPLIAIVALFLLWTLVETKMGTGSGEDRASDFAIGFQAWLNSPIIGYGYGVPTYYHGIHYGYSNSIMPILGQGGLYLAIPYIMCFCKWVTTCLKERDMQKFLMFACFIFLFIITIISFKFLAIFILFSYHFPRAACSNEQIEEAGAYAEASKGALHTLKAV